jgi:hypothetical protein
MAAKRVVAIAVLRVCDQASGWLLPSCRRFLQK